jgi:hypothetical protein
MSLPDILRLIRGAGKQPAERDSFYNTLRTDFSAIDAAPPPPPAATGRALPIQGAA